MGIHASETEKIQKTKEGSDSSGDEANNLLSARDDIETAHRDTL